MEDEETGEGSTSGTIFEDIDLTDEDWGDYDEKSDKSVCISEFQHQFVKLKH